MRILVLGGTRFIGRELVRQLAGGGHTVAVFHRGAALGGVDSSLPGGVTEFLGDRMQIEDHQTSLLTWDAEVVVDMYAMTEAGVRGPLEVLAPVVRRWVVASSMDVYRAYDGLRRREGVPVLDMPLTEDSPLRDEWFPYRETRGDGDFPVAEYEKILVERAVLGRSDVESVVLRLPGVYGPGDAQHRIAADLKRMDDRRPILLGRSEAPWRFAMGYVENTAAALSLLATHEDALGVYQVAASPTLTRREFVAALADVVGWNGRVVTIDDELLPDHLRAPLDFRHHLAADTSKIRSQLGYAEPVALAEGLRRTVEWERAYPPQFDLERFDYAAEDAAIASISGDGTGSEA